MIIFIINSSYFFALFFGLPLPIRPIQHMLMTGKMVIIHKTRRGLKKLNPFNFRPPKNLEIKYGSSNIVCQTVHLFVSNWKQNMTYDVSKMFSAPEAETLPLAPTSPDSICNFHQMINYKKQQTV